MRTIIGETDDLARLANDTLLITQMETGQFDYAWREFDFGPFLRDTVARRLMEHSWSSTWTTRCPALADPERLRQVLTNLTVNAAKYSPRPGSITVRARERDPQHVVIEVEDQGLGIPPTRWAASSASSSACAPRSTCASRAPASASTSAV